MNAARVLEKREGVTAPFLTPWEDVQTAIAEDGSGTMFLAIKRGDNITHYAFASPRVALAA